MADDHRVGDKSTALGFDSVVSPVRRQECSQRGIMKAALHVVRGRLTCEQGVHLLCQGDKRGNLLRDNLANIVESHPRVCPRDVFEIALQRSFLLRKECLESLAIDTGIRGDIKIHPELWEAKAIIAIGHLHPGKLPAREVIKDLTRPSPGGHVADVVQSHVPACALASKCVGESPWCGVFFEDEHPLFRYSCE